MTTPYVLGIDLGTTTCRAAVFDLDGREVAAAAVETPVRYPRPLWAEVDPEVWWHGVTVVVREALHTGSIAPAEIAGVGLSGLMHAPVLLDGQDKPVAPAMLWMDQRCAPQCDAIRRELEAAGVRPARELGSTVSGPKLRWLAEERPEVLAQAERLLLPKDFIRLRLSGIAGTDPGDAGGTGLFDRQSGSWLFDLVERCRVPIRLLPELRPPAEQAGAVTPEAAAATGLLPGTPVATGSCDTFCTRLGAGRLAPGEACLYLGTAAWIALSAGGAATPRGFGATSTTGASLRWLRDLLDPPDQAPTIDTAVSAGSDRGPAPPHGRGRRSPSPPAWRGGGMGGAQGAGPREGVRSPSASYDALVQQAEAVPPGAEGLFFLPHLMGERGPTADPLARGGLIGLTLRHGRGHLARAVIEGTAFQLRRLIDARTPGASPAAAVACGGAARSPLWMQVLADVTRLPLRVPAVVEAAALGAAILGGAAAGVLTVEEAQQRMVHPGPSYLPNPEQGSLYEALYARYCRLDDLLAPWFHEDEMGPPAGGAERARQ